MIAIALYNLSRYATILIIYTRQLRLCFLSCMVIKAGRPF
jgi:hypothetical protein